jgi:hypothetical protein
MAPSLRRYGFSLMDHIVPAPNEHEVCRTPHSVFDLRYVDPGPIA